MHGEAAAAGSFPPLPSPERLQALLFDAARLGRDDMIPALLLAGADVEVQDERGHTPLVLASYHGHRGTSELLLKHGALPDGAGSSTTTGGGACGPSSGSSALMGAAFKGYLSIARLLLDAGADPNFRNGAGQTALMMAALFGRDDIVDLLLAAGADPAMRDVAGNTAATLADQQGNAALAQRLTALP